MIWLVSASSAIFPLPDSPEYAILAVENGVNNGNIFDRRMT
jgi:hypothetical protein